MTMKTFTFEKFWEATNADRRAFGQAELLFGDAQSAFAAYLRTQARLIAARRAELTRFRDADSYSHGDYCHVPAEVRGLV
jgi:hypothetical protein